MTYGIPQSGSQTTCLPIGVGLSYDELTLLSCDVHRTTQCVRLFDIQTGRLKHMISSTQVIKKQQFLTNSISYSSFFCFDSKCNFIVLVLLRVMYVIIS